MDGDCIVTAFVVIDKTLATLGHRDHVLAQAGDAEVLTVAVVAAKYFQNHLARALQMLHLGRYLSGPLSVSRFRLADWLALALETRGALFATGEAFLLDSSPSRCAAAPAPAAARRCAARRTAATARRSGSGSSAGGYTWCAPPAASRSRSTCSPVGCTT